MTNKSLVDIMLGGNDHYCKHRQRTSKGKEQATRALHRNHDICLYYAWHRFSHLDPDYTELNYIGAKFSETNSTIHHTHGVRLVPINYIEGV